MRWSPGRPHPLVAKYYLYQATVTFGFFWPVYTVFLLDRGLSFTQIGLLGSVSVGLGVLGEVPTGYVGDRIGRRNSLLLGSTMLAVSVYALVLAQSFAAFVLVYGVWALGGAFNSGAGDAWLYDVLADRLDEGAYTRVRGRGGAVNMGFSAATMLTAGVLYATDPALPFLVGGTVNAAGVAVLLTMPKVDPGGDDDGGLSVRRAVSIVRTQLFQPGVRPVVLGMALFTGVVGVADTYIQPVAVDVVGLPTATLGPLYAGFSAVAAVASYRADAVEARLGSRRALFVLGGAVGAALALPLAAAALALPAFFLMKAVRRALSPVVGGYVNDNVDSVGRATTLSAAAMLYGLVGFVLKPAGGAVADAVGPVPTVAAVGALLVVGMVALRAFGEPTDAPTDASTPT